MRERLPWKRKCTTVKGKVVGMNIFVSMGTYPDGRPAEVFVVVAKAGSSLRGMLDSWSIMLSNALQYGFPLWKALGTVRHFEFPPAGEVTQCEGITSCVSLPDFVAQVLEREFPEHAKKPNDEGASS